MAGCPALESIPEEASHVGPKRTVEAGEDSDTLDQLSEISLDREDEKHPAENESGTSDTAVADGGPRTDDNLRHRLEGGDGVAAVPRRQQDVFARRRGGCPTRRAADRGAEMAAFQAASPEEQIHILGAMYASVQARIHRLHAKPEKTVPK